ncbi:hypothetical protein D3C72_456790 [compost metagenome]
MLKTKKVEIEKILFEFEFYSVFKFVLDLLSDDFKRIVEIVQNFLNLLEIVWMDFEFDSAQRVGVKRHDRKCHFVFEKIRNSFLF